RAALQPEQVRQRDVGPDLDGLTGPLGQYPGRDQAAHGFLQRVVVPLWLGPGVLGPGRGGQRVQDSGDGFGAFRGQIAGQDPGPCADANAPSTQVRAAVPAELACSSTRRHRACSSAVIVVGSAAARYRTADCSISSAWLALAGGTTLLFIVMLTSI